MYTIWQVWSQLKPSCTCASHSLIKKSETVDASEVRQRRMLMKAQKEGGETSNIV